MWILFYSWLRDSFRVSVLYLAAGAVAIPWALGYAFLVKNGWDSPLIVAVLLLLALGTVRLVWTPLERWVLVTPIELTLQRLTNAVYPGWNFYFVSTPQTAVMAPAVLLICLTVHPANEKTALLANEYQSVSMTGTDTVFIGL